LIGVVEQMYSDFNLNVLALVNMNAMIQICVTSQLGCRCRGERNSRV
jgi:hypothetical protein